METKEKKITFGNIIAFIILMACVVFLFYGTYRSGELESTWFPEKLVGGNEVVKIVCKEKGFGCSLLVEKQDGSRSWVWVPTVKM